MLHNRRQYLGAVIASTFLYCLILPLQLAESKRFARQNAFKEYRRSPELQRLAQASLFVRGGDESEIEVVATPVVSPESQPPQQQQVQSNDVEATPTDLQEIIPKMIDSSPLHQKLVNIRQRTVPAVLMLGGLAAWSHFLKEDGLILLVLVLQVGMFAETTSVIGGPAQDKWNKWWWFLTFATAVNGKHVFPWEETTVSTLAFGMTVMGLVANVLSLNWRSAQVEDFREFIREAVVSFTSLLLVVAPSSFLIATLEDYGMRWVFASAALVIINDTMAYFFGISLGKHALLPSISAKKTVEGFVGAAVSTIVAGYYLPVLKDYLPGATIKDGLVLALFASLIAPFGGFLASVIKRAYGKKDFGALLPGHGGLVDRLDCQLVMAPFVYFYLQHTQLAQ